MALGLAMAALALAGAIVASIHEHESRSGSRLASPLPSRWAGPLDRLSAGSSFSFGDGARFSLPVHFWDSHLRDFVSDF